MEAEGECGSIIGLWAVGMAGICFADGTGFRFGPSEFKRVKVEVRRTLFT